MKLDVLVADLFPAADAGDEPSRGLSLPALELLLARGAAQKHAGASLERWLAAGFGIGAGGEPPLAALSLRGEGIDPGEGCWLRADPVHLEAHGDRVILVAADCLDIDAREAADLVGALNAHFAADGLEFIAPDPHRWYARAAETPRIRTTPAAEGVGRGIEQLLPAGEDGPRWRRIMNEAQMLLHSHGANEAREARGAPAVNGVWFWGAGRQPALPRGGPYAAVWASHPLAAGIASAAGSAARALPRSGAREVSGGAARDETHLVILDGLRAMLCRGTESWRRALADLERDWFSALLDGLQRGTISRLSLHGLGAERCYSATLSRLDTLKLWRTRRALERYGA